ncbi:MAG: YIP1 family protein [Phycisphaeraceae bacterium]|nr:YIP1 family protein [Phycisphaeraceae bacterium]
MLCRTCEYPLWDLPTRVCPECGAPFRPGEFEFERGQVRFCCPHCDQAYYGTGPRGELVPSQFTCVSCNRAIGMDDMVVRPVDPRRVTGLAPWLRRASLGSWRAWIRTVGLAMVNPGRLMRDVPLRSDLRQAFGFLALTLAVVVALNALPYVAFGTLVGGAGLSGRSAWAEWARGAAIGGAISAGVWLALLLLTGAWALVAHGTLRLTGGAAGGLRRTFQCIAYTGGAGVVMAVPCIGCQYFWAWWVVVACIAVALSHPVGGFRATLAVAGPPAAIILLAIGGWAAMMIVALNSAPRTTGAATLPVAGRTVPFPGSETSTEATALFALSQELAGAAAGSRAPMHPARVLVTRPDLAPAFVRSDPVTALAALRLGDVTLAHFLEVLDGTERVRVLERLEATWRDATVTAFGDVAWFIPGEVRPRPFLNMVDSGDLWVAGYRPTAAAPDWLIVDGDGLVFRVGADALAGYVEDQNALRAEAGLAPILLAPDGLPVMP